MKRILLLSAVLMITATLQAQKGKAKPAPGKTKTGEVSSPTLKTENDSLSYAIGFMMGNYIKSMEVSNVNYAIVNLAMDNAMKGKPGLMTGEQANQCMGKLSQDRNQKAAAQEKVASNKFLEENKKRAGVMVTPSGLQYEIITKGTGPMPTLTDTVTAHYAGSLINGKEFDNSYKRGEPLTIPVGGVIRGWTEALQMMPVGSKWKLFIPSDLGYGDNGAGQDIPPGAALIFEVELLGIGGKK